MPDLFVPSSTGLVLTPEHVLSGANGTNSFVGYVHRPVPGQLLQTHGTGQFRVNHVGIRGSLTAEVITGDPGLARAVIKVTSALSTPQDTVQLSLDTQNRPVLTVAFKGGSIIKATGPGGPLIPPGTRVQFRVVWDSVAPLASGRHIDFKLLSGAPVPGNMGGLPTNTPWPTIPMPYVWVGYGANLSDFNGTILSLQVGDQRM